LIILRPSPFEDADIVMDIYNPDGSRAGACGNATRCVADLLCERTGRDAVIIRTDFGLLECRKEENGLYTVNMGVPALDWQSIPLASAMDTRALTADFGADFKDFSAPSTVSMGNPHCVFFTPQVPNDAILTALGRQVEHHPLFPQRTNVEFITVENRSRLRMRVWERGAGITAACGSGACAALVAAVRCGLADRRADLVLDGGVLTIEWPSDAQGVLMTGPVTRVFEGRLT